ncbi:OmpA family protein [Mucilaginibacter sp. cycad4]|uniref:OmpA family protein n=1 Tax=Mucilaginibacter sp. cycad4 TaxID=3342096 RepID=UPI002AABFB41|nr:OmpA family protein [Mucilaginibacter gossypii]WPU99624.1 OmpA family protein [Mucilaginibacter gossypii]
MKTLKTPLLALAIAVLAITTQACKTKKAVVQTPPPAQPTQQAATPPPAPKPAPAPPPAPAPAPEKPDYNFSNIQFEFNSAVLKTASYQTLDHIVKELKLDPSAKFVLNGNASAEGTAEHNMSLSVDRANSVKLYLVNSGVNGDNLTVKGWGESKPIADNTTEDGRVLNRRVEVKLAQ